jgi:hypothetical protein
MIGISLVRGEMRKYAPLEREYTCTMQHATETATATHDNTRQEQHNTTATQDKNNTAQDNTRLQQRGKVPYCTSLCLEPRACCISLSMPLIPKEQRSEVMEITGVGSKRETLGQPDGFFAKLLFFYCKAALSFCHVCSKRCGRVHCWPWTGILSLTHTHLCLQGVLSRDPEDKEGSAYNHKHRQS